LTPVSSFCKIAKDLDSQKDESLGIESNLVCFIGPDLKYSEPFRLVLVAADAKYRMLTLKLGNELDDVIVVDLK
jgi:hypothetical protein